MPGFFRAILIAACCAGPAAAMQPAAAPAPETLPLVLAGGCHPDVRRHFVPEFGATVEHQHRRDCSPVRVRRPVPLPDCHRAPREHHIPGMGRVYHRHVGPNCEIRIIRRSTVPAPG